MKKTRVIAKGKNFVIILSVLKFEEIVLRDEKRALFKERFLR